MFLYLEICLIYDFSLFKYLCALTAVLIPLDHVECHFCTVYALPSLPHNLEVIFQFLLFWATYSRRKVLLLYKHFHLGGCLENSMKKSHNLVLLYHSYSFYYFTSSYQSNLASITFYSYCTCLCSFQFRFFPTILFPDHSLQLPQVIREDHYSIVVDFLTPINF